ncbi:ankyrin [Xylaria longipes]|nr:ankyrin [Xylaria longipes]
MSLSSFSIAPSATRDIHLFELPPELMQLIFDHIVTSRLIERVMRIRIVNRHFKTYIDHSIVRLGLFGQRAGCPIHIDRLVRPTWGGRAQEASRSYIQSYILYQVHREYSTTSPLGRIRRAANALCENDGVTENEAVLACTSSLISLAMNVNLGTLLEKPKTDGSDKCSDRDLKADIYVAAVHLGKQSFVESLITNGTEFCAVAQRPDIRSTIFGDAFQAATMQGNLDMIKLLLSCIPEYRSAGVLPARRQRAILIGATMHGHQALFDFAFDLRPITLPKTKLEQMQHPDTSTIRNIIYATRSPKDWERVAAILEPDRRGFRRRRAGGCSTTWLHHGAYMASVEMVRHFLDKGAKLYSTRSHPDFNPLVTAIRTDNETIIRMLLDAGADPNLPPHSAMMNAVWKGNVSVVKLLLSRVSDIDQGGPPPIVIAVFKEDMEMFRLLRDHGARLDTPETGGWAMAVAKLHGLSSMVDVLVHEGVGEDVVLHHVATYKYEYWWYRQLWP